MADGDVFRTKMNEWGRIVIPAKLRAELKLEPGAHLVLRNDGGRLIVESLESVLDYFQSFFADLPAERLLSEELIAERRIEAEREYAEMDALRPATGADEVWPT